MDAGVASRRIELRLVGPLNSRLSGRHKSLLLRRPTYRPNSRSSSASRLLHLLVILRKGSLLWHLLSSTTRGSMGWNFLILRCQKSGVIRYLSSGDDNHAGFNPPGLSIREIWIFLKNGMIVSFHILIVYMRRYFAAMSPMNFLKQFVCPVLPGIHRLIGILTTD